MSHNTFGNAWRYPKLNPYAGLEGKIPLRYDDIYMGIEVEAENVTNNRLSIPGSFKEVSDGSLKLHGMEFVTVPIKLLYLEKELERLFGAIPKADFSSRTSIHVHMNARDFTLQNLLDFLKIYTLFERNLYRFSGDRWTNNFCIPFQQAPDYLINFLNRYRNIEPETPTEGQIMQQPFRWSKYLGLNISPITGTQECPNKYGTIEFRQMKGNNNTHHIVEWCNIIACIKFYVRSVDSKKLDELIFTNKGHTITSDVFRSWTSLIIPKGDISDIQESNSFLKFCMESASNMNGYPQYTATRAEAAFGFDIISYTRFCSWAGYNWYHFDQQTAPQGSINSIGYTGYTIAPSSRSLAQVLGGHRV